MPGRTAYGNSTSRTSGSASRGGAGVGYNAPASLGAALANKRQGRLTVTFNGDGDLMFVPSTLWTAAHHRIPLLYIVHNNRAYHQEYMYLQAMANRHGRGIRNTHIGTTITDPNIDYATVARGFGVYGEGPITDPNELAPALKRALAAVQARRTGADRRGHGSAVRVACEREGARFSPLPIVLHDGERGGVRGRGAHGPLGSQGCLQAVASSRPSP